jgi:Flp pilus assembly protein TadD
VRWKTIVFAGNCQARALGSVYRLYIAPLREERVELLELHPGLAETELGEPLERVHAADIVVEQKFDFPSRIPDDFLRPSTRRVSFPYVGGAFYWPFAMEPHVLNQKHPILGGAVPYPGEISDRVMNRMIRDEVPPDEAVQRYLDMDVAKVSRIDRLMEMHLDKQRQRDEATGIRSADFIAENFRRERLFLTTGHPNLPLFRIVAGQVFAALGVPASLAETALKSLRVPPYPPDEAPIHPALAAHFGLEFADAATRYRFLHEGRFTFAEYAARYMRYAWDSDLEEGISLAHRGDNARAVALLEPRLQRYPHSVTGWRAYALALNGLSRFKQAHDALDRAAEIDPADPETPQTRARVFLRQGLIPEAADSAREAIDLFPLEATSHRVMCQVMIDSGDLEGAASVACLALKLAPGDAASSRLLGDCLARSGDLAGAASVLRDALALQPERDDLQAALTDVLSRSGQTNAARLIEDLSATSPMSPQLYGQLGHVMARNGNLVAAECAFRKAIQLDPMTETYYGGLTDALFRTRQFDEALRISRERVAAGSRDAHLHHRLGLLQLRANDLAGAQVSLANAVELDGSVAGFYLPLTEALLRTHRVADAERAYQGFAQLEVRNAELYHSMAKLFARNGRTEQAAEAIRAAIALDGSNLEFQDVVAQIKGLGVPVEAL